MKSPALLSVIALLMIVAGGWMGELAVSGDYVPVSDRVLMGVLAALVLFQGGQMAAAAYEEAQRG